MATIKPKISSQTEIVPSKKRMVISKSQALTLACDPRVCPPVADQISKVIERANRLILGGNPLDRNPVPPIEASRIRYVLTEAGLELEFISEYEFLFGRAA